MKIILKLNNDFECYEIIYFNNYSLWILRQFLWNFNGNDNFMNWIKDPLNRYVGINTEVKIAYCGNVTFEKMQPNLKLHVYWDEDCNNDPGDKFLLIPIDQFVYITEKWLKLKNLNMPYIIITEENDKYNIEALDELTPEDQLLVDSNND